MADKHEGRTPADRIGDAVGLLGEIRNELGTETPEQLHNRMAAQYGEHLYAAEAGHYEALNRFVQGRLGQLWSHLTELERQLVTPTTEADTDAEVA